MNRRGDIFTLEHSARVEPAAKELYSPLGATPAPARRTTVTLIPYYTFHNRGITAMQVWIPYRQ